MMSMAEKKQRRRPGNPERELVVLVLMMLEGISEIELVLTHQPGKGSTAAKGW